jgi:hypothetical protein
MSATVVAASEEPILYPTPTSIETGICKGSVSQPLCAANGWDEVLGLDATLIPADGKPSLPLSILPRRPPRI